MLLDKYKNRITKWNSLCFHLLKFAYSKKHSILNGLSLKVVIAEEGNLNLSGKLCHCDGVSTLQKLCKVMEKLRVPTGIIQKQIAVWHVHY